jgi:hypothetical protein
MNIEAVESAVLDLLCANPAGLGEYEVLKALQAQECEGFPAVHLTESLPLFRMHFLLFHALYRLRDRLWEQQQGHLEISALNIRLQPYAPGQAGLVEHDPLREYYLDIRHLHTTTETQVKSLLNQFWQKFHAGERRQAALQVLGLREPVSYPDIKRQYRSLAMLHHPDRGGDAEMFHAISEAMEVLALYYNRHSAHL